MDKENSTNHFYPTLPLSSPDRPLAQGRPSSPLSELPPSSPLPVVSSHGEPIGQSSPLSSPPTPKTPIPRAYELPQLIPAIESSPIQGNTNEERIAHRRRKRYRRAKAARAAAEAEWAAEEDMRRKAVYDTVLDYLDQQHCSWGELTEYVSNPANFKGNARWHGFFSNPARVVAVLDYWTSSANRTSQGRSTVEDWALKRVLRGRQGGNH